MMYEILGMCVNRIATKVQTNALKAHLEKEIPDIKIMRVYSQTGNTSGTGNHVDCLSSVLFSTQMQKSEIEVCLSKRYVLDESCSVKETNDGNYVLSLNTSAPFADNIEGH